MNRQERMIASPDTIDGTAYISCFVYLNDPMDLSALRSLGVRVEKSFRGLSFITADVPVDRLQALAELDNVTSIKVSEVAQPATMVAREKTNVDAVIANTEIAQLRGMTTTYDGSGVVLGILDHGFDFGHIAFKKADGTSRIVRAFVDDGNEVRLYTEAEMNNPALAPTTDDIHQDHGTDVASSAGGSSVIIDKIDNSHYNMSVTNAHDSATYGGMAPGADLYLAGVSGMLSTRVLTAMAMMAEYADSVGKPLVVNCSWVDVMGPRNGKGEIADVVHAYFGEDHPNHIILFGAGNEVGNRDEHGGGGRFVGKKNASRDNPLRTIVRTSGSGGDYYAPGHLFGAWSDSVLNGKLYVLDNDSGRILWSWDIIPTDGWQWMDTLPFYNPATWVFGASNYDVSYESNFLQLYIYGSPLVTDSAGAYSLAIEVYPENGTADINIWGSNSGVYFSNYLAHPGPNNPWQDGSDDNTIAQEPTIDDVISVGAYTSKNFITDYEGKNHYFGLTTDDIAYFSSYATKECSVTGEIYPWITAPGLWVVCAYNHYITPQVDAGSYYNSEYLTVNDSVNPYIWSLGTSISTPIASGIVALWLQAAQSVGKSLTVSEVKDIMKRTAIHDYYTDKGPNASHFGYGKIDALAGIKLITGNRSVLEIGYQSNNDSLIAQHYDSTTNVLLLKHTLYKDNGWNSLCLPFSLDSAALAASELAGCTLMELDTSGFFLSDTTLTVTFVRTNHIEAGKPYLIKWPNDDNMLHPYFPGVTISNTVPVPVTSTDGKVVFHGTYHPVMIPANDSTVLVISWMDTLYYLNYNYTVSSCCAYFDFVDVSPAPTNIVFNVIYNDTPTGLKYEDEEDVRKFWHNGQLYIRRRGVIYDVTGRKIRVK